MDRKSVSNRRKMALARGKRSSQRETTPARFGGGASTLRFHFLWLRSGQAGRAGRAGSGTGGFNGGLNLSYRGVLTGQVKRLRKAGIACLFIRIGETYESNLNNNELNRLNLGFAAFIAAIVAILLACDTDNGKDDLPALGGIVVINGTAQVGGILTVNIAGLTGITGDLHYQWKRGSDSAMTDVADIDGATGETYMVVAADASKSITVTVTASGSSGSVTSEPTLATALVDTTPRGPPAIPAFETMLRDPNRRLNDGTLAPSDILVYIEYVNT